MGLREWFIRREVDGFEKENAMKWQAIKDWLNAAPGRKRGIGAILLGVAVVLEQLGHGQVAEGVRAANVVVQSVETTTALSGLVMTAWGWIQAHRQGRA